jgi:hypothetical protein
MSKLLRQVRIGGIVRQEHHLVVAKHAFEKVVLKGHDRRLKLVFN